MDFKFYCSHCGQHIAASDADIGASTHCPSCGFALTVPSPPTNQLAVTPDQTVSLPPAAPQTVTFTIPPEAAKAWRWLSSLPRRLLLGGAACVVALVLLVRGCGPDAGPTGPNYARPIERALTLDRKFSEEARQQTEAGTSPANAVAGMAERMRSIDLSACPPEFREAYVRHAAAWRGMAGQLKSEPDGVVEGLVIGFLRGLGGQLDGGASEMQAARNHHMRAIQSTWGDVEATAARHGAKLQP